MRKVGIATLPLHGGKAPAWLFKRMEKCAALLEDALNQARIDKKDILNAFKRLQSIKNW